VAKDIDAWLAVSEYWLAVSEKGALAPASPASASDKHDRRQTERHTASWGSGFVRAHEDKPIIQPLELCLGLRKGRQVALGCS
jgi:hypothetical protein